MFRRIWLKLTFYFDKFVLFCKTLPQKIKDFLILSHRFFKKLLNQIVDTIKMYKYFIIIFSYIFITLTYCPYLDNIFQCRVVNDPFFFFYIALFGFFVKIYMFNKEFKIKFSFTMNLFNFNLKSFSLFFSILKINFVKFFFFCYNVIFKKIFSFFRSLLNWIFNRFQTWNPLFKKTSYFSWYKSFVSRFLK